MWSETTVINPAAWSPKVEQDLLDQIGRVYGSPGVPFVDACAEARRLLADAEGPQTVTLSAAGATVEPFAVEDDTAVQDDLEARRAFHAAVAAADEAAFAADLRALEGGDR